MSDIPPRWVMTYLGRDTFTAECMACDWSWTGTIGPAHDAAIRHVRDTHL